MRRRSSFPFEDSVSFDLRRIFATSDVDSANPEFKCDFSAPVEGETIAFLRNPRLNMSFINSQREGTIRALKKSRFNFVDLYRFTSPEAARRRQGSRACPSMSSVTPCRGLEEAQARFKEKIIPVLIS